MGWLGGKRGRNLAAKRLRNKKRLHFGPRIPVRLAVHDLAAIDVDGLAGDITPEFAGEVYRHGAEFTRFLPAPKHRKLFNFRLCPISVGLGIRSAVGFEY